nr:MAG TPA: hypothetical protein [Caudoviricetes sp.]
MPMIISLPYAISNGWGHVGKSLMLKFSALVFF